MPLIDSTYFTGEILITNKTAISSDLTQAMTQYEKEILISLLGYKLYDLMINDQSSSPYKKLIEGAEFEMTFDGIAQTLKWEGLKNSIKESLIAYYTYYRYEERNYIKAGAVGTNKPMPENAQIVTPYPKMVQAWNNMLVLYGWFPRLWFKYGRTIMQPDGSLIYNNAPSVYNYMCANIADFPDWIFTPIKPINPFGI